MIKKIDKNNSIFQSRQYLKDRNAFSIIELNFSSDELLLYSNEKDYVICQGNPKRPIWIWTTEDIAEESMQEIIEGLKQFYFVNDYDYEITAKKVVYNFIKDNLPIKDDYFEMGALELKKLIKPRECDGFMTKANIDNLSIISKFWYMDNLEMASATPISINQATEDAKEMIDSNRLFVWKNSNDAIVCMVMYKIVGDQAKLMHVYTDKRYRSKGYAANLIYSISQELLNKELNLLLYTDYNYIPSNKAYQNVGYVTSQVLINFGYSKESNNG